MAVTRQVSPVRRILKRKESTIGRGIWHQSQTGKKKKRLEEGILNGEVSMTAETLAEAERMTTAEEDHGGIDMTTEEERRRHPQAVDQKALQVPTTSLHPPNIVLYQDHKR